MPRMAILARDVADGCVVLAQKFLIDSDLRKFRCTFWCTGLFVNY